MAIVQARMGSTRLPGKVLAEVFGAPMLSRLVERLRFARSLAGIVIATPEGPADGPVRALAVRLGVRVFVGSADDVLSRYAGAADRYEADPIVRITADCPLIDPTLVDQCVATFAATKGCDYCSLGGEFPDGLDAEVFSAAALSLADSEAQLPSEREHVTPFIWKAPRELFHRAHVPFPERLGHRRWTVDEPRDLEFVRAVYARLYRPGQIFGWQEVEALLQREPELARINGGIERNSGYRRSLERDQRTLGRATG
jgi:spore coat polysaccharide biosynthesis protein SpsF (cytidylyltransferase family)